jgi:6-phosphogluconolactonase
MTDPNWACDGSDRAVADYLADRIRKGARRIGVPGGKTPEGILGLLSKLDLPWQDLQISLVDDRVVAPDHPASNFGLLRRAFAGKPVALEPLCEGPWEDGRFDLVWLGMGDDGHVASIFPGSDLAPGLPPAVVRTVPDPLPPEAPFERLTLTLAALTDSDEIILVVRGRRKRDVIEDAIAGRSQLPIADLLGAARSPITIFWRE